MKVLVIGAGLAGVTAALALRAAGIDVQLYEQASALREVGAGIGVSPNAAKVLHALGLESALRSVATLSRASVLLRWDDGRPLGTDTEIDYEQRYGAPTYLLHRAELLRLLVERLPPSCLHLGRRCIAIEQDDRAARAKLADGTTVEVDAIVGADGIHSLVREKMIGPDAPHFAGIVAYRGLVPIEAALSMRDAIHTWFGPNQYFLCYAAGRRFISFVGGVPATTWREESWTTTGTRDELLAAFDGWDPRVRAVIAGVDKPGKWALYDRDPLRRWSHGRITLLGDAAHAMLHFLAQGASQGIEDAAALARCLAGIDSAHVPDALARYEAVRRPRATRCQTVARHMKHAFRLPDGEQQRSRDEQIGSADDRLAWIYGYDVTQVSI